MIDMTSEELMKKARDREREVYRAHRAALRERYE